MPCNTKPTNCAPCGDCPPAPDPLLPRCDILLPDGVFANATVTVDQGCVVAVTEGEPFVYQPEACCGGGGGSGGSQGPVGPQGPAGPAGDAATISISATNTLPAGQPASVQNVGTAQNASLVFNIPKGADGASGGSGGSGVTFSGGGWNFVNGSAQALPALWPPVVSFTGNSDYASVNVSGSIGSNGLLTVNLTGLQTLVTNLQNLMDTKDLGVSQALQLQINDLQDQIDALVLRVTGCGCP